MKSILLGILLACTLIATGARQLRSPDTLGEDQGGEGGQRRVFRGLGLPFSFVGEGNKPAGYSIDLCQRVISGDRARAVGVPDLKVNWIVGTAAERVQMVASGKADMDCANTTDDADSA